VVEAADGYRAVFALAEFDPDFTDRVILLADRRDDYPLSSKRGAVSDRGSERETPCPLGAEGYRSGRSIGSIKRAGFDQTVCLASLHLTFTRISRRSM